MSIELKTILRTSENDQDIILPCYRLYANDS